MKLFSLPVCFFVFYFLALSFAITRALQENTSNRTHKIAVCARSILFVMRLCVCVCVRLNKYQTHKGLITAGAGIRIAVLFITQQTISATNLLLSK